MDQYVKVNIKESVRTKLKERAAAEGMTLADYIESLATQTNTKSKLDEIVERRSEENAYRVAEMKGLDVPPAENDWRDDFEETDLSEWEMGICPRCCIDFLVTKNPEEACEHWKQGYRMTKMGKKQLDWKNTAVNRFIWENYFDPVKLKYAETN